MLRIDLFANKYRSISSVFGNKCCQTKMVTMLMTHLTWSKCQKPCCSTLMKYSARHQVNVIEQKFLRIFVGNVFLITVYNFYGVIRFGLHSEISKNSCIFLSPTFLSYLKSQDSVCSVAPGDSHFQISLCLLVKFNK